MTETFQVTDRVVSVEAPYFVGSIILTMGDEVLVRWDGQHAGMKHEARTTRSLKRATEKDLRRKQR